MPPGPSLPPKPYPKYGWIRKDWVDDQDALPDTVNGSSSRMQTAPYVETSAQGQAYSSGYAPLTNFHAYSDDGDVHQSTQEGSWGGYVGSQLGGLAGPSDVSAEASYGNGLSGSMDTVRHALTIESDHHQANPPSIPPPTSVWHRQGEVAAASRARRQRAEDDEEQDHQRSAYALQPPSDNLLSHPADSSRLSTVGYNSHGDSSRPISTATAIISLYGDDWTRGSSSRSSSPFEEEQRPRAGHRVSRPLPAPPSSSTAGLSIPPPSHSADGGPSAGSSRAHTPLSQHALSQPYHVGQASAAPEGGYFESVRGETRQETSSTANLVPSTSSEGPLWSPTIPGCTSIDSSSVRTPSRTAGGDVNYHRLRYSFSAASNFGAESDDKRVELEKSGSRQPSTAQSVPRLRIDSSASAQSPQRRAPLPSIPPLGGHRNGDSHVPLQLPQPASDPQVYDAYQPISRQSSFDDRQDDDTPTPVQTAPKPGWSSIVDTLAPQEVDWMEANCDTSNPRPVMSAAASLANDYSAHSRNEKRRTTRDRRSTPRMTNYAILSHLAVLLRDTVPRADQVKGSINYPFSFTGKDVVSTLQRQIPRHLLAAAAGVDPSLVEDPQHQDSLRRVALHIAQSLNSQLFFHEVDWGAEVLQDGVEQVYSFLQPSLAMGSPEGTQRRQMMRLPSSGIDSEDLHDDSYEYATEGHHKRNHPVMSNDLEELPTGVFVPLIGCYSPLCGRSDGPPQSNCYSPACPRAKKSGLRRGLTVPSLSSTAGQGEADAGVLPGMAGGPAHKAWAELMPKEVLDSLPKREVTRQNAILEHIQKEEDFLADLQLLETLFIRGLEKPSAVGDPPPLSVGPERDDFIREVFANHRELVWHVSKFVEALHIRQREESPIIHNIGDLFLNAALEWQSAFVTYVANYPIAKSRIGREQSINPRFAQFIEACRREPACRRLGLDNFIHRALPHLQRHPLLLQTIIDKTEEENPDRESCIRAKEIIVEQCKIADTVIQAAQIKAQIRGFAYNLQTKRNKAVIDMDLLNEERQLIHEGRVYRKPDFTDLEWTELQAILFDNFFAVTKLKSKQESDQSTTSVFVLAKRPIAVELLEVSGFNEPSVSFSIGLNALHLRSDREARDLWPFTIQHAGGKMEPLTLYATSKQRRNEWRAKIEEAKGLRRAVVDANKAFETATLSDSIFAIPATLGVESSVAPMGADPSLFHGRITCAVPFRMADQRRLVALGCADGVWIGLRNDPSSYRKVLHLKLVTQCAVMEEFGIFIVLADKTLISYSLEALVPSSTGGTIQARPPQKLSGNRGVLFFGVGVLKERTLLVYMKKKANESVFKALEPVINQPMASSGKSSGGLFTKIKNDMSKNADWFRMYKVFFIPSEAYTMQFLRSKLAVVCARGFEIMNLDTLLPGTVPDFTRSAREDPRILNLARRVELAKPLGMFKLPDGESFLLCYDAFACYVDRGGEPIRLDNIVEWEGSPTSVAFSTPYILAMDPRFIEIREAATGRLMQVIRGYDIRYISACSVVEGSAEAEPSIICVQRRRAQGKYYDEQVVFELVQTNPLSLTSGTEGRREPFKLRHAVEMANQRQQNRSHLQRTDTSATALTSTSNGSSSGMLSYSNTMSSTRSGAGGVGSLASSSDNALTTNNANANGSNYGHRTPTVRSQSSRGALPPESSAPAPAGWI